MSKFKYQRCCENCKFCIDKGSVRDEVGIYWICFKEKPRQIVNRDGICKDFTPQYKEEDYVKTD